MVAQSTTSQVASLVSCTQSPPAGCPPPHTCVSPQFNSRPEGDGVNRLNYIYALMIYTAYVLEACISITRGSGRGLGPGILEFFGPSSSCTQRELKWVLGHRSIVSRILVINCSVNSPTFTVPFHPNIFPTLQPPLADTLAAQCTDNVGVFRGRQ